jgi:protease-4
MSQASGPQSGNSGPGETSAVLSVLLDYMRHEKAEREKELKRERFWRNVRTVVIAVGLAMGPLYLWMMDKQYNRNRISDDYVAMVRVSGVIGPDHAANAERIGNALERAFKDEKAKGVIVAINSPGGSPVQSSIIHDKLVELRQSFPDRKVWAVGEDMLTSGAYFIAVAAPKICVNRSTLTGSIGVIRDGWGLDKVIQRFDIERRVFTAGGAKDRLDMFKPLTPEDREKVRQLLDAVHEHFKSVVRAGRGDRLKASEAQLYTGDFWTGDEAVRLGLADRLCDVNAIMAEEFGVGDAKDYTPPPSLLTSLAGAFGTALAERLQGSSAPVQLLPAGLSR